MPNVKHQTHRTGGFLLLFSHRTGGPYDEKQNKNTKNNQKTKKKQKNETKHKQEKNKQKNKTKKQLKKAKFTGF